MKTDPLVLTFDIGTQSARAILVNQWGSVLGKAQIHFDKPYLSPQPGWAEQDPDLYWNAICETSRMLKSEHEALWPRIIAVTCTCIRATTICLDSQNRPLRSAIVWLDKRVAENLPVLPAYTRLVLKAVGMTGAIETVRSHLACNWIIQHQPDIWAKTEKFVLLSAYLNFLFCGNLIDSTANTVGVVPFDYKNGRWLKKNAFARSIYMMEDDKLIDLVKPGEQIGEITPEAAAVTGITPGTPYIVTGADKACEALGLSCNDETSAALSFGTTATIVVATKRYVTPEPLIPPNLSIDGGYLPEVETFRGYWLLSWFSREFAAKEVEEARKLGCRPEELLNKRLKEVSPGCDGLMLQPSFTADAYTPHARGAAIGFSDLHTRTHLYRAIIEGINFSLMEGLDQLQKRGRFKVEKLYVAGGGSRSDEICQITANMFGLPLFRTQAEEVGGLGSSLVAFVTMKVHAGYPEALKAMVKIRDSFVPNLAEHEIYRQLHQEVYSRVFDSLAPLYAKIDRIVQG